MRTDTASGLQLDPKNPSEASMSISGIPSNPGSYATSATNNRSAFRTDFSALAATLDAGDLSGAQSAFAGLQARQPGRFGSSGTPNDLQNTSGASPIGADIAALSKALHSGDLTGARAAFKKVQQDMGSTHRGHHHHRKHAADQQNAQSTSGIDASRDPLLDGQAGITA